MSYIMCRSKGGEVFKRYVEVLASFNYGGRELMVHEPIGTKDAKKRWIDIGSKFVVQYTVTDRLTGLCIKSDLSIRTPTARAALRGLRKCISEKEWIGMMVHYLIKEKEAELRSAPTYHQWKREVSDIPF